MWMEDGTVAAPRAPWRRTLIDFRVPISATLMIVALAALFVLTSQSGASIATYLLAAIMFAGAARWRGLLLDWGLLLVVALLLYMALTSLWSTPWDGRGALGQLVRAVLVFAFVVSIAECMQVDWFRRRMAVALAIVGALAALAAIAAFIVLAPEDERLNGLGQLDTHVTAAMVYAVAGLAGLAWLLEAPRAGAARWWVGGAVAVLAAAIALTSSRNAMAGGAFAIACLVLSHRVASVRRFLAAALACAALLGGALALAYVAVPGADALILPRGDSFRPGIWAHYWRRLAEDGLWFGLGVLTDDDAVVAGWPVQHPHSLYLAVAWQGGLAALALTMAVVAMTLRTLLRHYDEATSKLALAIWALALPAYLLDGYELLDKIGWTWLLFWLPVAIGLGLRGRQALADARRFGVDRSIRRPTRP